MSFLEMLSARIPLSISDPISEEYTEMSHCWLAVL